MKTTTKLSVLFGSVALAGTMAQASTDYGPAVWRPACSGKWYTTGYGKKFYVIHDMEGYYLSSISFLQACNNTSSVHYCVNGKKDTSTDAPAGEVSQLVRDTYYAWHALCWNEYSMGTEHEGFVSNPAWYTEAMYKASALLTKSKATKYGFLKDRNHVVGHNEKSSAAWVTYANANLGINATCNTHTDPGPYWNWTHYMSLVNGSKVCDFNGNGLTDRCVFRPSNNTWYVNGVANTAWGVSGDIPLAVDSNCDGTTDYTLWRVSDHSWHVKNGASGLTSTVTPSFGQSGDIPVPADYSGDGVVDFAVWRPSNGTWYFRNGATGTESTLVLGVNGDIPVPADYNGDGYVDKAVWRPSNGTWYIKDSLTGTLTTTQYGQSGDIPVPGDYTGGGMVDKAFFRPSNGTWYFMSSETGNVSQIQYGTSGDIPAPGDYNGDGITDFAVWRPSNNTWYVNGLASVVYGTTGDKPLPLPYAIRNFFFP